jgi:NADH:ubiquinone reductase (H+-translocating)
VGRRAGVQQFAHRNDTATPLFLSGRPAAVVKELICRGTVWQLRFEARHPGAVDAWLSDGTRREALLAAPEAARAAV